MLTMKQFRPWRPALLWGLLLFLLFLTIQPANAAIVRNYSIRFTTNDTGDIALIGNKLSSCNLAVSGCTNAINGIGSNVNNNNFNMVHVDIDGDPSTFNSSSATLTLPAGASVTWAGLYWGGDVANGTPNTNRAKLRVPGASGYTTITATQTDSTISQQPGRTRYQGFSVVTAQVRAAGSGTYTVADVQATAGNIDSYAAWALVVVYQDVTRPMRNMTVFDGFAFVTSADPAVSIPVSGFITPLSGPVNTKIGTIIYEGDLGLTGDSIRLNGTTLSDAQNPSNNFFNSTISNLGTRVTSKNPDHINQMAFDIDLVSANGILGNGANNATIQLSTSSDAYYPGMISFVTDLHAPQLAGNIVKSVTDINGGQVEPNDILQYSISVANTGMDAATNVILRDSIPANSTYVPNSLVISAGPNSGIKSDTAGNDQAEYDNGLNRVVFRLGTGANATNGGTLAIGASTTLQFQVRVNSPLANATVITNQASVSYNAATTGQAFTTPSNPVAVVVVSAPQVSLFKQDTILADVPPLGSSPGDTLRYTIQLSNGGNANATGVVFSDIPGANTSLVNGSVTTSQGSITAGNGGEGVVGVDLGTVAGLGGSATITFDVLIASPIPAGIRQVANQGFLNSNELPPIPTDDPDTVVHGDSTVTQITAAPVLTANKVDNLLIDADSNGVPSPNDTLEYVITVSNIGNQDADGVVFNDAPDVNSPLVVESVTTTQGVVASGNVPGDRQVIVNIGTLSGNNSATIRFRGVITDPLPVGVISIANQGMVTSSQLPVVMTDDPDTAVSNDPTITPLTAAPVLQATKSASLINDADANGVPSPGDTLRYHIITMNIGHAAATGITVNDTPDAHTTLVVGSVQTTQGVVLGGNTMGDTAASVNLVTLLGSASATVSFDVTINSNLSGAVTQVANQGVVNSNELPSLFTDDPVTAVPGDPTITPISAVPILVATKQDTLFSDTDANGQPSPGDTLLYNVTIANIGNAIAQNIVFSDTLDAYSTLLVGTVQSSSGSIISGNGPGDTKVSVNIGTIPAGGGVTVAFQVSLNNPLPPAIIRVVNQGMVSSSELPLVLTDDPDTPAPGDPTITPITALPRLLVAKSAALWSDADNNGIPSAGDSLAYQIVVANHGNTAATHVLLDDQVDSWATLVPFSVQTSQGSVLTGNNPSDEDVQVDIGTLPANVTAVVAFQVVIRDPLPAGLTEIANQATVQSDQLPTILSDDPTTPPLGDPTLTLVVSEPRILAQKSETLWLDADNDGQPSIGDTLLYSIQIANTGHSTATLVVFTDTPDPNTTLVVGTTQTSRGVVVCGNIAGDTKVQVDVDSLPAGTSLHITFQIIVDDPLGRGITTVSNQGVVNSAELPDVLTDDPLTPTPGDPTLTSITAVPILDIIKRDTLLVDADGDGQPSPGDTLLYNVNIRNSGHTSATSMTFTDTPGTYTTLVAGTVSTNRGTVTTGNGGGDATVVVNIGTLPVDRNLAISFQVTINNPLPAGVNEVSNQGTLNSSELGLQLTNDPDTGASDDVTATVIQAAPDLQIIKDDGGAHAVLGSSLSYTLSYQNLGNQDATGVVITETVPAYTTFNTALSDPAWSCTGTAPGSTCIYAIGNLSAGAMGVVGAVLNIDPAVPPGINTVRNTAMISDDGDNGLDLSYSDNSGSDDAHMYTSTAVSLFNTYITSGAQAATTKLLPAILLSLTTGFLVKRRRRRK